MSNDGSPPADGTKVSSATPTWSLRPYVELLRPEQWVKNVVVFAGPAAGLKLSDADSCLRAGFVFLAFCLAASATYTINDIVDREADLNHPTKRLRPIARGAIRPSSAFVLAGLLILTALVVTSTLIGRAVTAAVILYLLLNLAYSTALKQKVILDVIIIAIGFVLRAFAGALAVQVPTSAWLIACVFTLCLFMGFGKRRCELAMIGSQEEARQHRRTLIRYTPHLLTHLITVSAGIAVITFLQYTLDASGPTPPFEKQYLFYTLPLVVYGIFRFAMLSETGRYSGPTEIVLKDPAMRITIVLWGLCALVIAYQVVLFGPGGLKGLMGNYS